MGAGDVRGYRMNFGILNFAGSVVVDNTRKLNED